MVALDSLVFDLIFAADVRPTPDQLLEGLGGEAIAKTRMILDPDLDAPQYEMEVSPTVPLRRRGERRLLIVGDEPMRKNPPREPIVARDLRPERDRLIQLVDKTGARFGRMQAFGSWGDAAVVVRNARDLRGLALLPWALDPTIDVEGRRRAKQLSEAEFEHKLASFDQRLDELDDDTILARVLPAHLEKAGAKGDLIAVDVLSDIDGSWDVRKSYELEKRVGAWDLFSRIPGARVTQDAVVAHVDAAPTTKLRGPVPTPPADTAPVVAPRAPAPEPEKKLGPPISAADMDGRVVLRIPSERFDLDAITALGKRQMDLLTSADKLSGKERDRVHEHGAGFIAPLAFLSEVFLDGKPLDRKRFESEAAPIPGGRALEAHLPRFGPVRVIEVGGKRYVTSEISADPAALAALVDGLA